MDTQIHIRVFGRVQGVGYRAWTVRQAQSLNLKGFVRNRRDGSVEVFALGPAEGITQLLKHCHDGPTFARVDDVRPMSYPDAPMPSLSEEFDICSTV